MPAPGPSRPIIENPNLLRIDVVKQKSKDGHNYYRMNGRWWKDDFLFDQLKSISDNDPDTTVIVNCGPNARHEKLVALLDACADADLTNLNIVNDNSITFDK